MDLVRFVRARLAEEHQRSEYLPPGPWRISADDEDVVEAADGITVCEGFALSGNQLRNTVAHVASLGPETVQARIRSDLAVVDECAYWVERVYDQRSAPGAEHDYATRYETAMAVLTAFATRYAEHPDFRAQWKTGDEQPPVTVESWLGTFPSSRTGSVRLSATTVVRCVLDDCPWTYELIRADQVKMRPPRRPVTDHADYINAAVQASVAYATKQDDLAIRAHAAGHTIEEFLTTIAKLRAQVAAAGEPIVEHAIEMSSGGMQVRWQNPWLDKRYPLAEWIEHNQRHGGKVHTRKVIVVEPWSEVPRVAAD